LGCAFKALKTFYSALKCKKEQPMHMLWNQHPSMHYIWMDTGRTGKLSLTGSFSSMIYMHSLRISTLFFGWMLAGPKQVKSHWVSIIHDLHAFTKNQYTILDGCWLDKKTFLIESLSSMTHMPSQRISAHYQSSFKTNYIILKNIENIKNNKNNKI
jgi:hypothetical protein